MSKCDYFPNRIGKLKCFIEQDRRYELLNAMEDPFELPIVGELSACIAHEIGNSITSIKGFIQLLQTGINEKQTFYDIMASEIDRIEHILSELLVLGKPQAISLNQMDILLIINNIINLLDAQAKMNNVQIMTDFESDNTVLNCNENQIKQLCINFIKNAIESMPNGGSLVIQTRCLNEKGLLIRFIDQGYGIPNHILSKLGQPFYSTKEKGTGLSFMASKRIIENHNGSIVVTSEINRGTTIEVIFPQ